jgi:hypothetical protein
LSLASRLNDSLNFWKMSRKSDSGGGLARTDSWQGVADFCVIKPRIARVYFVSYLMLVKFSGCHILGYIYVPYQNGGNVYQRTTKCTK